MMDLETIKGELLDEAAALVFWHRAQERLAAVRTELDELKPEQARLAEIASALADQAGAAQTVWARANWQGDCVPGKSLEDLYQEWQGLNGAADRAWGVERPGRQRIIALEAEERELGKVERPTLDALGTLMEALK